MLTASGLSGWPRASATSPPNMAHATGRSHRCLSSLLARTARSPRGRPCVRITLKRKQDTHMLLESFIQERWTHGEALGELLRDATNGEVVAQLATPGIDFAAALEHARTVGGPALRSLTFHERAGMLKALAKALGANKDELYALSYRTGATKHD